MKYYLVLAQDEYNNLYYIGRFDKLLDSVDLINSWLSLYNVSIKSEDLKEYPSTFNQIFDLSLSELYPDKDELSGVMIRGFIIEDSTITDDIKRYIKVYEDFPTKGVSFKDILPIFRQPKLLKELIKLIISTIPEDVDCIVSPESRGFLLGTLVAYELDLPFVPLRKPNKLPGNVISESYSTEYSSDTLEMQVNSVNNRKCYFIDDVYATGGTYEVANKLIKSDNGILLGGTVLLSIFDTPEFIKTIFNKED